MYNRRQGSSEAKSIPPHENRGGIVAELGGAGEGGEGVVKGFEVVGGGGVGSGGGEGFLNSLHAELFADGFALVVDGEAELFDEAVRDDDRSGARIEGDGDRLIVPFIFDAAGETAAAVERLEGAIRVLHSRPAVAAVDVGQFVFGQVEKADPDGHKAIGWATGIQEPREHLGSGGNVLTAFEKRVEEAKAGGHEDRGRDALASNVAQGDRELVLTDRNDVEEIAADALTGLALAVVGESADTSFAGGEDEPLGFGSCGDVVFGFFDANGHLEPFEVGQSQRANPGQGHGKASRIGRRTGSGKLTRRTRIQIKQRRNITLTSCGISLTDHQRRADRSRDLHLHNRLADIAAHGVNPQLGHLPLPGAGHERTGIKLLAAQTGGHARDDRFDPPGRIDNLQNRCVAQPRSLNGDLDQGLGEFFLVSGGMQALGRSGQEVDQIRREHLRGRVIDLANLHGRSCVIRQFLTSRPGWKRSKAKGPWNDPEGVPFSERDWLVGLEANAVDESSPAAGVGHHPLTVHPGEAAMSARHLLSRQRKPDLSPIATPEHHPTRNIHQLLCLNRGARQWHQPRSRCLHRRVKRTLSFCNQSAHRPQGRYHLKQSSAQQLRDFLSLLHLFQPPATHGLAALSSADSLIRRLPLTPPMNLTISTAVFAVAGCLTGLLAWAQTPSPSTTPAGPNPPTPPATLPTTLPSLPRPPYIEEMLFTEVTVDGVAAGHWLIDTGANTSVITPTNPAMEKFIKLPMNVQASSATGKTTVQMGTLPKVKSLDQPVPDLASLAVIVLDLSPAATMMQRSFDGVLGVNALGPVYYLDFPGKKFVPTALPEDAKDVTSHPWPNGAVSPSITAEVNGVPIRLLVDSGQNYALSLSRAFLQKHDMKLPETSTGPAFDAAGIRKGAKVSVATFKALGQTYTDLPAQIAEKSRENLDGIIGVALLKDGLVEVDTVKKTIRFSKTK